MSKFHEKVEGRTKQFVGQIIGDDQLGRIHIQRSQMQIAAMWTKARK